MFGTSLRTSTSRQEDYFGGAFPNDYMKQWNPNLSDSTSVVPASIQKFQLTVHYEGTSDEFHSLAFQQRLFCHLMVASMPEEALDELVETLEEMIEFYISKAKYIPEAPLDPVEKPIKIVERYEQSAFRITDEE